MNRGNIIPSIIFPGMPVVYDADYDLKKDKKKKKKKKKKKCCKSYKEGKRCKDCPLYD
jgi:hypothetical protein